MQDAVPKGEVDVAILGTKLKIKYLINEISNNLNVILLMIILMASLLADGTNLELSLEELSKKNIKFIKFLLVHHFISPLMKKATDEMRKIILELDFSP